jgi:hypothetical protein
MMNLSILWMKNNDFGNRYSYIDKITGVEIN